MICTGRAPAVPAGVTARTCVAETNVTPVAGTPLTSTVAPEAKLVPVSVMVVPPVDGPDVGLIDVEEMARGARAADLGSLLARLCSARILELETRDGVHRAAMALLEGYAPVSPVPELSELRWHVAAAMLVERAQRAVTRLNGLALARLDRLVAEGLRLLEAEGVGL